MLFRRHNKDKRSKFAISSVLSEEAMIKGVTDVEVIKSVLNNFYNDKILDSAPYHYVVTSNGFFKLKSTDLYHNDNSFMEAFNDDIRILLTDDDILQLRIEDIANVIAIASAKHSMIISSNVEYSEYTKNSNELSAITKIINRAILIRNQICPMMSICEHVIDDRVIINEKIYPITNRNGHTKLKFIANKYSLPVEALKELNPHVDSENLKSSDIIFLPKTITIKARLSMINSKKEAEFRYQRCHYSLRKEVDIVG